MGLGDGRDSWGIVSCRLILKSTSRGYDTEGGPSLTGQKLFVRYLFYAGGIGNAKSPFDLAVQVVHEALKTAHSSQDTPN